MRNVLDYFSELIAILLVPAVIVLLLLAVLYTALIPSLTQPDTLKASIERAGFYDQWHTTGWLTQYEPQTVMIPLSQVREQLSDEDWQAVMDGFVDPREDLQTHIEASIDHLYDVLAGSDEQLLSSTIQIPDARVENTVEHVLDLAPPCMDEQLNQLEGNTEGTLPICLADDPDLRATVADELTATFRGFRDALAEDRTILDIDEQTDPAFRYARIGFAVHDQLILILFLLPAVVFSLITFFGVRSLRSFGRYTGWISLLTGLFLLLLIATLSVLATNDLPPGYFSPDTTFLLEVLGALVAENSNVIFVGSIGFLGAGFVLLVTSLVVPKPRRIPV